MDLAAGAMVADRGATVRFTPLVGATHCGAWPWGDGADCLTYWAARCEALGLAPIRLGTNLIKILRHLSKGLLL